MGTTRLGPLLAATRDVDDPTVWHVLADALDDHDDTRAALVRAHLELDRRRLEETELRTLVEWIVEHEAKDQPRWHDELPQPIPLGIGLGWNRGFLHQVFVRRLAPDVVDYLNALEGHPLAQGLAHVRLMVRGPDPGLFRALVAPPLGRLVRNWSFARQALGPRHARILAETLSDARSLDVSENALGDGGIVALSKGRWPSLEQLHVGENGFGAEGSTALAGAPWARLSALTLMAHIDVAAATALAGAPWFENLAYLGVVRSRLRVHGLRALVEPPRPHLRHLNLGGNGLGDAGVRLLTPQRLPRLQRLVLIGNAITDAGVASFVRHEWPHLRTTVWDENPDIGERGNAALAARPYGTS